MLFILDTDVLSNLRKKKPHPLLVDWITKVGWEDLATTVFNIMEIQVGIERARLQHPDTAAQVEVWLGAIVRDGQPQILTMDIAAARLLGKMYATPELRVFSDTPAKGKKAKTGADLVISAIAIANRAIVATNNHDDYLRVDAHFQLPGIFNPIEGRWISQPQAGPAGPPDFPDQSHQAVTSRDGRTMAVYRVEPNGGKCLDNPMGPAVVGEHGATYAINGERLSAEAWRKHPDVVRHLGPPQHLLTGDSDSIIP